MRSLIALFCVSLAGAAWGFGFPPGTNLPPSVGAGLTFPINTIAPAASGTAQIGSVLTTTQGTWTNANSFTQQWVRNGIPIPSATSLTYTTVLADFGQSISAVVTATGTAGTVKSYSNPIGPITGAGGANATPASILLNSIGVSGGSAAQLDFIGAKHVRGGTPIATLITACTGSHADVDLADALVEGSTGLKADAAALVASVNLAGVNCLHSVEGANAENSNSFPWPELPAASNATCCTGPQSFLSAVERQNYIWSYVHNTYPSVPVYHASQAGGPEVDNVGLQYNQIPAGFGANVGPVLGAMHSIPDLGQLADYANLENFVQWPAETVVIDNQSWLTEVATAGNAVDGVNSELVSTWLHGYAGYTLAQAAALPKITSQTGWQSSTTAGPPSGFVTPTQQGKLYLNLFLDAIKNGFSETYIFQMVDGANTLGLYDSTPTIKPSGTYIHNLTTIMADAGTISPGTRVYSIASEPATVHDLLFEKSDGTYWLAVWDERTEISGTTDSITVTLGVSATVNRYDPTVGTAVVQTYTSTTSIPLTMSDHPFLLKIP